MRWMWNDQTGGTNRFLMRRAGLVVYVTGLLPDRGSKKCYSSTGTLGDATEVPSVH